MEEHRISLTVNGQPREATVPSHRVLRDFVRNDLGLTGTKEACEDGMCGACSLHVDGDVVKSCLMLAVEADGRELTTIEGLAGDDGQLHPVQQALIDNFGFQCGFCTPGFAMTIAALVESDPPRDVEAAQEALVGNICRCTGYTPIVQTLLQLADQAGAEAGRAADGA